MPDWQPPGNMSAAPVPTKMSPDDFLAALDALCEDWKKSEEWAKKGEFLARKVVMPCINELRYAGRQITEAVSAHKRDDDQAAQDHLREAGKNLIKARHDAVDAMVGYISTEARDIRKEMGAGALREQFSDYDQLFHLLSKTEREITGSRREQRDRDKMYTDIMDNDLPQLQEYHDKLAAGYSAIREITEKQRRKQRITFWIGMPSGWLAFTVTILFWLFWK